MKRIAEGIVDFKNEEEIEGSDTLSVFHWTIHRPFSLKFSPREKPSLGNGLWKRTGNKISTSWFRQENSSFPHSKTIEQEIACARIRQYSDFLRLPGNICHFARGRRINHNFLNRKVSGRTFEVLFLEPYVAVIGKEELSVWWNTG